MGGAPTVEERGIADRGIEKPPYEVIRKALALRDAFKRRDALLATVSDLSASEAVLVEKRLFSMNEKDVLFVRFWKFTKGTRKRVKAHLDVRIGTSAWSVVDEDARVDGLVAEVPNLDQDMAQGILDAITERDTSDSIYLEFRKLAVHNQTRFIIALAERIQPPPLTKAEIAALEKKKKEEGQAQNENLQRLIAIEPQQAFVGPIPHASAPLEPLARKLMWLGNLLESIIAFFEGLFQGCADEIQIDPVEMLESVATHFYEVPFVLGAFSVGTADGILDDAIETVKQFIDILISPYQFAKTVASIFKTMISDAGDRVCYQLGYAMGADMATKISAAAGGTPTEFAAACGRAIGPPVVYIVLQLMGIPVGIGPWLKRAVAALEGIPEVKTALKALEGLYTRKGDGLDADFGTRGTGGKGKGSTSVDDAARQTAGRDIDDGAKKGKGPKKSKKDEEAEQKKKRKKEKEDEKRAKAESAALDKRIKAKAKLRKRILGKKAKALSKSDALVGSGKNRQAYRKAVARKASEKNNPMGFLVDDSRWVDGEPRLHATTSRGMTHDQLAVEPQRVESGHTRSGWSGGDLVIVMTAYRNRIYAGTIEAARKAAIDSVPRALDIGGIAIEVESALDMFVAGLLSEKALRKATLLDLER